MILNETTKMCWRAVGVEKESLLVIRDQFLAAMSREMKSPIYKIIGLVSESESPSSARSIEIQDAARYLLSLVDELAELSQVKP
jgi:signal transduction histidine kinase